MARPHAVSILLAAAVTAAAVLWHLRRRLKAPVAAAAANHEAPAPAATSVQPPSMLPVAAPVNNFAVDVPRLQAILTELRATLAGSENRRLLVLELLELLTKTSKGSRKEQKVIVRAFIDAEGPAILYDMESCMNGDWVGDAKNGTMRALSSILSLPGPIGQAFSSYRLVAEKNKVDAAYHKCDHGTNPPAPAGTARLNL